MISCWWEWSKDFTSKGIDTFEEFVVDNWNDDIGLLSLSPLHVSLEYVGLISPSLPAACISSL